MPERNLVVTTAKLFSKTIVPTSLIIAMIASTGCSKLAETAYIANNFEDRTSDLAWPKSDQEEEQNRFESAAEYIAGAQTKSDDGEQKDLARIIAESDELEKAKPAIRLTATPDNPLANPTPRANLREPGTSANAQTMPRLTARTEHAGAESSKTIAQIDLGCEHNADCDCHEEPLIPSLARVEPIPYPGLDSQSKSVNRMPPPAIFSQPLRPLMFDGETRQVQMDATTPKQNTLRNFGANSPLTHVETAQSSPPIEVGLPLDASPPSLNPIEPSAKSEGPDFHIAENPSIDMTKSADVQYFVPATNTPENNSTEPTKVPDPVVIVATVSPDDAPPYAEPPTFESSNPANPTETINDENQPLESIDNETFEALPETDSIEKDQTQSMIESPTQDMPLEVADAYVVETDLASEELPRLEPESLTDLEIHSSPYESANSSQHTDWSRFFPKVGATNHVATENACPGCTDPACCPENECQPAKPQVVDNGQALSELIAQARLMQLEAEEPSNQFEGPRSDFVPAAAQPQTTATAEMTTADFDPAGFIPSELDNSFEGTIQGDIEPEADQGFVVPMNRLTKTIEVEVTPAETSDSINNQFIADEMVNAAAESSEIVAASNIEEHPDDNYKKPSEPEVQIIREVEVIDNTVPWDVQLDQTIDRVKQRMQTEVDANSRNGLEVNLRLLEVFKRQVQSVADQQQALSNQEKAYWQHQLDAINSMLSHNEGDSDQARHTTTLDTLDHLRKAVARLESIAKLRLANPAFCREISGFGQFRPFVSNFFATNQKMLVYFEVENYHSEKRTVDYQPRYHTKLRGSYVIYDGQGRAVQQAEYPAVNDVVRNRRRDFYMYFPVQLNNLPAGEYQMELLVEDLGGNKTATLEPMKFQVR